MASARRSRLRIEPAQRELPAMRRAERSAPLVHRPRRQGREAYGPLVRRRAASHGAARGRRRTRERHTRRAALVDGHHRGRPVISRITPLMYVGGVDDCLNWYGPVVHACKYPCYMRVSGHQPKPGDDDYLSIDTGKDIFLNMIDTVSSRY